MEIITPKIGVITHFKRKQKRREKTNFKRKQKRRKRNRKIKN